MKNLSVALIFIYIISCAPVKEELRSDQIVGKWTNLSLLVTMKRFQQEDSILKAEEGEWEKVLQIKPIVSAFNADSTFSSEYYALDGKLIQTTYGKWWVRNDSLIVLTEDGETTYHFTVNNDRVRFRSMLDWDQDGESDDFYDAVQIKVE